MDKEPERTPADQDRFVTPPSLTLPDLASADRHYARLTRNAARSLIRPVGVALAVLYAVFSTAHLLIIEGFAGKLLSAVALLSAVFYLVSSLAFNTRWVRHNTHVLVAGFSFVALGNSILHLFLTGNPAETSNLALVFLGVGALIFHGPTLAAVLAVGAVGWVVAGTFWEFSDPYWIHYAFALVSTSVLAALIFKGRVYFIRQAANLESVSRERELHLKASRQRYEELFSAGPGMICVHDLAGQILDANAAGARALGIPRDRLVGMNLGPFVLSKDRQTPNAYLEELARNRTASGLVTVQGADGRVKRWKYRSTLFANPTGPDHVVAAALDVTELEEARQALSRAKEELERAVGERTLALEESNRRLESELEERARIEEELRQKHKLEALGRLAGGIAHEFNNILTVLSGNLEMAMDDAQSGASSMASLEEMEWATARATNLVSQILAFSRMDQGTHSILPLRPLLEETLGSLGDSLPEGIEIDLHIQGELGSLRGSPEHLKQLFGNLISNSQQAVSPEGGRIQVQASPWRATALESSRVDIKEGTPCVRIQISDNGRGIPFPDQDRVFDPFFTTHEVGQGVGLGLSVAHGITRSHGGDIALESEPTRGTTITLIFPTMASEEAQDASLEDAEVEPSETRILVVDDETAIVRLVSQTLTKKGYQVTHSPDPLEALASFNEAPEEIDLLLTDLSMPEMRGDDLGTEIRRIRPGFPILIMTGFGGFLDLATLAKEGPTSILPKPFSGESLVHAVAGVLRDARAQKARPF